jgi:hypothetical protein
VTSASASPFDGVVEFFTLARASAQLGRLGEDGRVKVAGVLALGRQRAEAAETLWSNGHTAEALRLAFAGLDATLDAATAFANALQLDDVAAKAPAPPPKVEAPKAEEPKAEEPKAEGAAEEPKPESPAAEETKPAEPASDVLALAAKLSRETPAEVFAVAPERWRAALAARGVGAAKMDRVGTTLAAKKDAKLPDLDVDVSPALADLFQRVMDARHVVDSAIGAGAWTAGDMRWARVRRWLGVSVTVVAVVMGSYFALHEPAGVFASASDVWQQSATFSADMAIDGRNDTSWLLPDRATGWVEQRMSPARHVSEVVLLNTSNGTSLDRATSDYRLEIYSGGSLARAIDGHFDWSDTPQPVTHQIDMDNVQRVRFVVRGYHRTGAGLAEMTVR